MRWRAGFIGALLVGCTAPSGGIARLAGLPDPHVPGTHRVTVQIDVPAKRARSPGTAVQQFDPSWIRIAAIRVTGEGINGAIDATASLRGGVSGRIDLLVPEASNLVFEVIGLDAGGMAVPHARIAGVASIPEDAGVRVGWDTTPPARVIQALAASGSALARSIDRLALQAFCNRLIYGTADGSTASAYASHPALVDSGGLATAILGAGAIPATGSFKVAGARIAGAVSGLIMGQTATVSADDPSSPAVVTDAAGAFELRDVLPGVPVIVRADNPFFGATWSAVPAIAAGQQASRNLALSGNYLLREPGFGLANGECGLYGYQVAKFTRSPVRIVVIQPTGARAQAFGYDGSDDGAVGEAVDTMRAELADLLSFEVSSVRDDDVNLPAIIRRSDVFVSFLERFETGGCGFGLAAGCAHYYPGGQGYNFCNSMTGGKLVGLSYQAGVRLTTKDPDGNRRNSRWKAATALHELTHALGLGHSFEKQDVMLSTALDRLPTTYSAADLRTLRLHYSLPANYTRDHSAFDLVPIAQNAGTFSYDPAAPE